MQITKFAILLAAFFATTQAAPVASVVESREAVADGTCNPGWLTPLPLSPPDVSRVTQWVPNQRHDQRETTVIFGAGVGFAARYILIPKA
ncbi:hypothetical protein QBC44DRAFT_405919 [Cladorrhinum sp. PSN332]|nr:hypothetical protein QBC44DRAFT_405919 [Cladorrhinum sp. PSN332]